ncbi:MAG TPA: DnaD domain protein, partial [Metabacillus sp.]|nr:DnaD domain protein [Metabacillus sp.]
QPISLRSNLDKKQLSQEEELMYQLETISPRQFLTDVAGGIPPSVSDLQIIEEVMVQQKLEPGVVNVLIYYVMLKTDMKLTRAYVQKIASHWTRKHIKTVKEAMDLAKQEHRQYQQWAEEKTTTKKKSSNQRTPIRKEVLPSWLKDDETKTDQQEQPQKKEQVDKKQLEQFELEKKKLFDRIKKYKDNKSNETTEGGNE